MKSAVEFLKFLKRCITNCHATVLYHAHTKATNNWVSFHIVLFHRNLGSFHRMPFSKKKQKSLKNHFAPKYKFQKTTNINEKKRETQHSHSNTYTPHTEKNRKIYLDLKWHKHRIICFPFAFIHCHNIRLSDRKPECYPFVRILCHRWTNQRDKLDEYGLFSSFTSLFFISFFLHFWISIRRRFYFTFYRSCHLFSSSFLLFRQLCFTAHRIIVFFAIHSLHIHKRTDRNAKKILI